jgi:predicted ATP-grasp superfamily ATP-dependent carboligase
MHSPDTRRTVVVTDAGRGSAIAFIRSLGRAGFRVVAADAAADSLGFQSRYAAHTHVYPDPRQQPDAFVASMLDLVASQHVDLLVPITDLALQPIVAHRESFEAITRLAAPETEALRIVTDKARTMQLAQELGVPVPKTSLVSTVQEALESAVDFSWPIVLKPQASHHMSDSDIESFKVTYAATLPDLADKMRQFEGRSAVLLQEYFEGDGEGVELLMSHGRPLAAFQHKRLRELPITGGPSTYRESQPLDPKLYADATRLLERLRWTGLAMVEFKVGAAKHMLMEINGRVWGSLPLATRSGMDFPLLLARLYLDGEAALGPDVRRDYRTGLRCRDLPRDLAWIAAILAQRRRHSFLPLPGRGQAVAALVGMLDPRSRMDVQAWDDPLPGLAQMPRILPRLLHKAKNGTDPH